MADDQRRGLYQKFKVTRTDGSSGQGEKHEECSYFVLDLNHDPHAVAALTAYANSCINTHPRLAIDLTNKVKDLKLRWSNATEKIDAKP